MPPRTKRTLVAATIVAAIAVLFWMRSLASWRPVKWGQVDPHSPIVFLSKDGKTALYGGEGEGANIIETIKDLKSGHETKWPQTDCGRDDFYVKSPPGDLLLFLDFNALEVRDAQTGHLRRTFRWSRSSAPDYDALPKIVQCDSPDVLGVVSKHQLLLWNLASGKLTRRVDLAAVPNSSDLYGEAYALSANGARLVGCGTTKGRTWDAKSGALLTQWANVDHLELKGIYENATVALYCNSSRSEYSFVDTSNGKLLWKVANEDTSPTVLSMVKPGRSEVFLPQNNCQVFDLLTGRIQRKLAHPRQSDGDILRVTHDWIYTLTPRGEILRWRAR